MYMYICIYCLGSFSLSSHVLSPLSPSSHVVFCVYFCLFSLLRLLFFLSFVLPSLSRIHTSRKLALCDPAGHHRRNMHRDARVVSARRRGEKCARVFYSLTNKQTYISIIRSEMHPRKRKPGKKSKSRRVGASKSEFK